MSRERWDAERIADQGGRVVVVTGATSGIGKEAARVLAGKNATVILAVRNIPKGEEVRREFVAESGGADVSVLELDLARLRSVRRFAEGFADAHDRLDVLINNAGVMFGPYRRTSPTSSRGGWGRGR